MTASSAAPVTRLAPARGAVTLMFLVNGTVFGSWVSRIPDVSARLRLGEALLGLALLGIAVGAIAAMPLVAPAVRRFGSRKVTTTAATAFCASLPLLGLAANLPALAGALIVFGAANGALDVSMNDNGSRVERALGRPVMGTLHAAFSAGGAAGALAGGLAAGAGITPALHFTAAAVVLAVVAVLAGRCLADLPDPRRSAQRAVAQHPARVAGTAGVSRPLLLLLLVGLCAAFAEGAVADWSALYLVETLGSSTAFAAGGFVGFSALMVIGRLVQDPVVSRVGEAAVRRCGAALAAVGMTTALLTTDPLVAVAGFAGVGVGLAAIFPLTMSGAGRLPGMAPATAIAAVSATAYGSLLAGPPLVGLLAHATSLNIALWSVTAALMLVAALPSPTTTSPQRHTPPSR